MRDTAAASRTSPVTSFVQSFNVDRQTLALGIATFVTYFITAKLGLYIYYTFATSPALIWPPVGIALAAVLFGGYRMWVPIFLAQLLALATNQGSITPIALVVAVGYALQAVIGLYVLRYFEFEASLTNVRSAVTLVGASFVIAAIEPTIATTWQWYNETLRVSPLLNWGRAWGGGLFSILVLTPLITTWYRQKDYTLVRTTPTEVCAAFALLIANTYFLFWTPYPSFVGISVIFFLPAVLIWFALRLHPRWLTLALFVTSVGGITGTIVMHPSPIPLSEQLLADEVYIGMVAAIFLIFVSTVEERRRSFLNIQENNKKLDYALAKISAEDTAKSEFIAILAHELRNPLAPIVSAHEWLRLQPQSPESLEALESAEENINMMVRLLDDLLDTVRITQHKFELKKESVQLQDVIAKSLENTTTFLRDRRLHLQVSLPAEPLTLFADPVRLKQIVINLLNNAGKYTEPGGHITLSCSIEGDELKLEVRDSGVGIAQEKLGHIFEPFNQIPQITSRGTGLGIGLSLTKRLVEMHGGTIEAASDGLNKGSTFTVRLPLPALTAPTPTPAPQPSYHHPDGTLYILVVDDNESGAEALKRLLVHHGHDVTVAHTGNEALTLARSSTPDAILLDIGLPDMSGYDVARELRALGSNALIIALTGFGQEEDLARARAAGFDEHLTKPVGINQILTLLAPLT